jgi:hypothetical protein
MRLPGQSPRHQAELEQNKLPKVESPLDCRLPGSPAAAPGNPRVLCLVPQGQPDKWRADQLVCALHQAGCITDLTCQPRRIELPEWDVIVAYHPHIDLQLMHTLREAHAAGLALITVMDRCLEKLPANHPDLPALGLTTQTRIQAYTAALLQSDLLVTHSRQLEAELCRQGFAARFIPEAWIDPGGRWQRPVRPRHTLNLGWIGSPDQMDAIAQIRRMVLRVMREFPFLQLVIAGDEGVYSLFDALPASRRIYLPSTAPEDLPFVFGMIDLLLIPLQETAYHRARSDLQVMQAGLRGIPWLASPLPAYREWNAGGICIPTLLDWRPLLRSLVSDAELRARLGQQGRQHALERHAGQVAPIWLEVFAQAKQIAALRTQLSPEH